jgi:hypothetical protein
MVPEANTVSVVGQVRVLQQVVTRVRLLVLPRVKFWKAGAASRPREMRRAGGRQQQGTDTKSADLVVTSEEERAVISTTD